MMPKYVVWHVEPKVLTFSKIVFFSTMSNVMSSTAATSLTASEIEPLRAKWGWIVALGIVYVIAGFVALGSVLMATVATVFIVGVMMLISGVAEVINAFQIRTWGKFLLWVLLGILYDHRRICDLRTSIARSCSSNPFPWGHTCRLRYHADHLGLLHETQNALALGSAVRRYHATSWPDNSEPLASFQLVHSRSLSRH